MENKFISNKQFATIFILMTLGSALIGASLRYPQQNTWLALLCAGVLMIPQILIITRILHLFKGLDLKEAFFKTFGKLGSKILLALYAWYAFHVAALTTCDFSKFVGTVSLTRTPQIIIALPLVLLSAFIVKKGIEVFGRASKIMIILVVGIFILSLLMSLPSVDFNNILPIFTQSKLDFVKNVYQCFAFPFAETVLLMFIFPNVIDNSSAKHTYFIALSVSIGLISLTSLRNLLVLGNDLASSLYYPTYQAVTIIKLGSLFQRSEAIVAAIYVFCYLAKLTVCMFALCKCLNSIFEKNDFTRSSFSLSILILGFSLIQFPNIMQMFDFLNVYPTYAAIFQIILPIIIWLTLELKLLKSRRKLQTGALQQ